MPAANLESTFGVRTLTAAIRTFNTKKYDSFFTRLFQEGRQLKPDGRKAEWDEITSSRATAPIVGSTSPAPIMAPTSKKARDSAMITIKEGRFLPWDSLFLDRHMGELKANAKGVIMDELEDMSLEVNKTVELACASVLTTAGLVVSPTAIPQSDQTFTLTFTPTALNFTTDWATITTAIVGIEVPKIQLNSVTQCGLPVSRAIMNDVTTQYVLENTEVQKFLANQQWAVNFLKADVTNEDALKSVGLAGLNWKINPYGYNNGAGYTKWMPNDKVIFLPDDLSQVLGFAEGIVGAPPDDFSDVGVDNPAFVAELPRGLTVYAVASKDPFGIKLIAMRTILPILLFPQAVTFFTAH